MSLSNFHGGFMETTFTHIHRLAQLPFAITPWRLSSPKPPRHLQRLTMELINFLSVLIEVSLVVDIAAILMSVIALKALVVMLVVAVIVFFPSIFILIVHLQHRPHRHSRFRPWSQCRRKAIHQTHCRQILKLWKDNSSLV